MLALSVFAWRCMSNWVLTPAGGFLLDSYGFDITFSITASLQVCTQPAVQEPHGFGFLSGNALFGTLSLQTSCGCMHASTCSYGSLSRFPFLGTIRGLRC